MKRLNSVIFYLLVSCVLMLVMACEEPYYEPEYGFGDPLLELWLDRALTVEDQLMWIDNWVGSFIEYKSDVREYWQTPEETYNLRTGDCEDMAILFMYFVNKYLGYEPEFLGVKCVGGDNHAVSSVEKGMYYFGVSPNMVNYDDPSNWVIILRLDYYHALFEAEELRAPNIEFK